MRKVRIVGGRVDEHVAPLAGESALARYTMLASTSDRNAGHSVIALERALRRGSRSPLRLAFDDERTEIQTWAYDPEILARDGVIDRLSLYLSVRASPDERVAQAAEELNGDV